MKTTRVDLSGITTDVLIIGGGPAGLTAALALRKRGVKVTVADARKPPIDKACGEGIMPDSLRELATLGVDLTPEDGAPFQGIRFVNHGSEPGTMRIRGMATAEFPEDKRFPSNVGVGLHRLRLHEKLVNAAEGAGVELRWQTQAQLKRDGHVIAHGCQAKYGWLIGADGQSSPVRAWADLDRGRILTQRFGFRQHFRVKPWSPYVEVHWGRMGQAYVTPVAENEVCVAVMTRHPRLRLGAILEDLPILRERLAGGLEMPLDALDAERGALTTTRRLRQVARGRVALVGDASGSADAITGEGMGMGFRQGLLLAECIGDWDRGGMARYNQLHPKILQLPQTMARIMLLMDRWEGFRDRAIAVLGEKPGLFARMLGVHLGVEAMPRFLAAKGFEVAWRLASIRTDDDGYGKEALAAKF
ncbi:NAD(P)/FAD-dependent oxidoreductase [Acidicapsa dinghuensis]|uniref:NAD(P)/FAD-dependent oxidoreductase n=1 Tax=Acidicapsa dinghuensis TaxID=2218256 RepID=A0ABW1ED44_9BACT|nr:NAD(P)/FAD-dependent oxidoreductase [Acidicapsa dinghuensis]